MRKLNLPSYDFRYRTEGKNLLVLDVYRKRFVKLTPEEEVRQRFARYLVEEKGFPASLMMTEHTLEVNKLTFRCDILVHKPAGHPALLVECKAPEVKISQATFDQVARICYYISVPPSANLVGKHTRQIEWLYFPDCITSLRIQQIKKDPLSQGGFRRHYRLAPMVLWSSAVIRFLCHPAKRRIMVKTPDNSGRFLKS